MASNILEYIKWRGDIQFKYSPINKVDGLIFAQLSYLNFSGLVSYDIKEQITLRELAQKFMNSPDFETRKNMGFAINKLTPDLLFACGESERFGNVKISGFRSVFNEEIVEQFAAMTFCFDDTAVITFRGTDDTIIGWQEDFNLTFMDEIPSQVDAVKYFKEASGFFKKKLVLAGHSKGGNLAVYTAVRADPKTQKRIEAVFNMDGPGFSKEFFESAAYKNVEPVIKTVYPQCDIVGMLFNHGKEFQVIKSLDKGINQHDPFNWLCKGVKFKDNPDFTDESKFFYKTINEWESGATREEKERFVTALFDLYHATGFKTNYDISENVLPATKGVLKAFAEMDRDTKHEVKRLLGVFRDIVHSELPIFKIFNIEK